MDDVVSNPTIRNADMPVKTQCQCGRSITARDEFAGKRVKCPDCGRVLHLPAADNGPPPLAALDESDSAGQSQAQTARSTNQMEDQGLDLLAQIRDQLGIIAGDLRGRQDQGSPPVTTQAQKQYKVLTQKDKWFSGKFDPERLEQAVNAYASQGWTVKGITTASIPGFGGAREELIVLLER